MMQMGNTVAFIPIRGGSKSIPLKNIKKILGRPLVYWVLDAASECSLIDAIVVSTDSKEIRETVEAYHSSKITIIDRSPEVSSDTASTESVMLEFANAYSFENIILIQATSPLLSAAHLEEGITLFSQQHVSSVLSVVRQKRFIWNGENGLGVPHNYNPSARPRRQEFSGFLVENGAFYITSRESLLKTGCRISGNIGMVEMPEETYFEIDEPDDWLIIEHLLKKYKHTESSSHQVKKIRCVITDCDGVLTDGGMYYTENGDELKKFNAKDGKAFQLLREAGYLLGIITGEQRDLVQRRAEKLKLNFLYMGISDKMEILDTICSDYGLDYDEIAYIGDDINDLEVISAAGLGCAVADAVQSIKDAADFITTAKGGEGAFRELAEYLLQNR